ncbi:hypothetical protein D3C87_298770 [compost metagenome]
MKKLKLGFVALALISGVSAFATGSTANEEADCTQTTGNIDATCPFGSNPCCVAPASSSLKQTQGGLEVDIAPFEQVLTRN